MSTQTNFPEQIEPELWARLVAQAKERGGTVNELLQKMLDEIGATSSPVNQASSEVPRASVEEFMAAMESLAENVPPLPRGFSREDIYFPED